MYHVFNKTKFKNKCIPYYNFEDVTKLKKSRAIK